MDPCTNSKLALLLSPKNENKCQSALRKGNKTLQLKTLLSFFLNPKNPLFSLLSTFVHSFLAILRHQKEKKILLRCLPQTFLSLQKRAWKHILLRAILCCIMISWKALIKMVKKFQISSKRIFLKSP